MVPRTRNHAPGPCSSSAHAVQTPSGAPQETGRRSRGLVRASAPGAPPRLHHCSPRDMAHLPLVLLVIIAQRIDVNVHAKSSICNGLKHGRRKPDFLIVATEEKTKHDIRVVLLPNHFPCRGLACHPAQKVHDMSFRRFIGRKLGVDHPDSGVVRVHRGALISRITLFPAASRLALQESGYRIGVQ